MKHVDVFNGDADGICALHQLRLHEPHPDACLVTGVKRDITLLEPLTTLSDAIITVLDVSLDRNRQSLETILARKNRVIYIDHHFAGALPQAENFTAHIDTSPLTCTSLIINALLPEPANPWAIVGAFGDNLDEPATRLGTTLGLQENRLAQLKELGILLNYNGYGTVIEELFFPPQDLYTQVHNYPDPFIFMAESPAMETLRHGYRQDMDMAQSCTPCYQDPAGRVFILPQATWASRVAGVYANTLARAKPQLAHALATTNDDGSYRISVRAPLSDRTGADTLCRQFPSGGGRAAAAGINTLPADQLDAFIQAFSLQFTP